MSVRELLARLAGSFGGGRRDREIEVELRFHREQLEADYRRAGLSASEARRAVQRDLGGALQAAEACRDQRGLPFLDALRQDVTYGLRVLRRAPGFTVAALLTLAIGIGANTAIFSMVNGVLLAPLPYAEPDRLMAVGERALDGSTERVGFDTVVDWRARSHSFATFALMRSWQPTLMANGEAERLPAVRVTANYFDMMGVAPALGRGFVSDEDTPATWHVVLLSDALWRRRFGADPTIVGRTIQLNDVSYRVLGVMPASFKPLDAAHYYATAELWAPLGYAFQMGDSCRDCRHLRAFGRLRPGVTPEQAAAEMSAIQEQLRREHPSSYEAGGVAVVPLQRALTSGVRTQLWLMLGAVAFVLVIACANVANLLLARSQVRQRELALRAVLGAGRRRIIRQLLTESAMLSAAGGAAGIAVGAVGIRLIAALAPASLPRLDDATLDPRVLAFTALAVAVTTVLVGAGPAWGAASAGFRQRLAADRRTTTGGGGALRSALVVADLVLALTLLAGAGIMLRSVASLARVDPGFGSDGIVTAQFSLIGPQWAEDAAVFTFQQRVLERLKALPGAQAVAITNQVPFGGDFDCRGFHVKGRMKPHSVDDPCIQRYGVSPGYRALMNIPLLRGRFLSDTDSTTGQPAVVVSAATARLVWGDADPIGSEVRVGNATRGPWYTVVGVVGDVRHEDLAAAPIPALYVAESQSTDSFLVAVVKSSASDPGSLGPAVRAAIRELDPSVPVYGVATLPQLITAQVESRRFIMQLLAGFAATALVLAAIGLYGLVAYSVAQRTREVGVRVALGAQRMDVLRVIVGQGATVVAAGVGAGLLAALAATRLLGNLAFGVSPIDPLTFAGAAALLLIVALVAHVVPVRRALAVDPAVALRQE